MTNNHLNHSPYVVLARYTTKDSETETVVKLLGELAAASRQEPANISYDYYRQVEVPGEILIVEKYTSIAGFEAHRESEHFQRIGVHNIIDRLVHREVESYQK